MKFSKKDNALFLVIVSIYILVPLLIYINRSLFPYKFTILVGIGLLVFILLKVFRVPNKKLGLSKENIFSSIKRILPLNTALIIVLLAFKTFGVNRFTPNETWIFYIFYIFISCPLQEFLYRGVFGYFEKKYPNRWHYILISSFCYSFVHIIYRDILTCFLTLTIGIIWYLIYRKDYNLVGVTISHIILGIITIAIGLVN